MGDRREFQVLSGLAPDAVQTQLGELSAAGWAVAAFTATGPNAYAVLVSREYKRRRGLEDRGGDKD